MYFDTLLVRHTYLELLTLLENLPLHQYVMFLFIPEKAFHSEINTVASNCFWLITASFFILLPH